VNLPKQPPILSIAGMPPAAIIKVAEDNGLWLVL
jgi:hypothetical protein